MSDAFWANLPILIPVIATALGSLMAFFKAQSGSRVAQQAETHAQEIKAARAETNKKRNEWQDYHKKEHELEKQDLMHKIEQIDAKCANYQAEVRDIEMALNQKFEKQEKTIIRIFEKLDNVLETQGFVKERLAGIEALLNSNIKSGN